MTWVWAMSHGMWSLGIVIGVVAVVGLALDRARPRAGWLQAALVPALSSVAAGLTPIGPALYGQVLAVGSRSQYFSEWNPPDWTYPSCMVLAVLLAVTITLMVRRRMATWLDLGLLLLTGGFAVSSWRTVPVAAMIIVPLAAARPGPRDADPERRARAPRTPPRRRWRRRRPGRAGRLRAAHLGDPPPQPSWVDPALSSLPAGTKVVGAWDWGGYLMWRYPQLDLLMHGYGDTFTTAELQRNTDIEALSPGWDDELRAPASQWRSSGPAVPWPTPSSTRSTGSWSTRRRPSRCCRHRPGGPPAADRSRDQVAHDRVGKQPALTGQDEPLGGSSTRPRCTRPATSARPCWSRASTGSPSRSRISSSTRSTRRVSASSVSRAGGRARAGGQPTGVRRGVLDVPPPHAADVAVRARPDAPPVRRRSSRARCAGTGSARRAPSWTPRTSSSPAAAEPLVGERGTCRRGRPRRASAARRARPGGPARCRPRR